MAEVINILSDDDDDDIIHVSNLKNSVIESSGKQELKEDEQTQRRKRKKKRRQHCLNPDCRSNADLSKAGESIRRFYGVQAYRHRKNICLKCLKHFLIEKNKIVNLIRDGTNVVSNKISLGRKTYVLSDSDESGHSDFEESSGDSELEYNVDQLQGWKDSGTFGGNLVLDISEDVSKEATTADSFKDENKDDPDEEVDELQNVVLNIISEFKLDKQISDGWTLVGNRLNKAEKNLNNLNKDYSEIERKLDKLRISFYKCFQLEESFLPSLEIGPPEIFSEAHDVTEVITTPITIDSASFLPPIGPLIRAPIKVEDMVYMMKYTKLSKWIPAQIVKVERLPDATETFYHVQYKKDTLGEISMEKVVSAKYLAYHDECQTRIPIGTRVIAIVEGDNFKAFYVGIVAEIPTGANKFRYLIFFDDGYAQYVHHFDIRVVIQGSVSVWEDVAADSRDFIKDYLETYPERPLVRVQKHHYIKTELEGKWYRAQVLEIDCSLVKMRFPIHDRVEWVYRGSTRLLPLYHKKLSSKIKSEVPNKIVRRRTLPVSKTGPILEYVNFEEKENFPPEPDLQTESDIDHDQDDINPASPLNDIMQMEESADPIPKPSIQKRAVARKSSASKNQVSNIPMSQQLILETEGFYTSMKCNSKMVKFSPHQCTFNCIKETNETIESKHNSPLMRPLLLGWNRQICKQKKKTVSRDVCAYIAPCGRRLRSLDEIHRYLKLTKSELQIDLFSLDSDVSIPREWESSNKVVNIKDITNDKEGVYISCVNSIDRCYPKKLLYRSERLPSESVKLNLDPNYLVCCSCEDDCSDKSVCECSQLTSEATNTMKNSGQNSDIGYKYKRLEQQVTTGIFECNSHCRCKSSCLNRVVQFQIKQKLQLFKTAKRGWGVRTLHDIPLGSFICVYVGKMLTETEANEEGMTDGADDYYANLDFIEVVESLKEGYESDVEDIEADWKEISSDKTSVSNSDEEEVTGNMNDLDENQTSLRRKSVRRKPGDDDNEFMCRAKTNPNAETRERSTRLLAKTLTVDLGDDDSEDSNDSSNRKPQTFEPKEIGSNETTIPTLFTRSMREFYAADESVYVMDAKATGNIGRYLNHSCNPNVFVQNVFVDTHDPRFPWISFFAGTNIKAGMELTWDYNYEVGSVPGRVKYCYCRSSNCRGRLL